MRICFAGREHFKTRLVVVTVDCGVSVAELDSWHTICGILHSVRSEMFIAPSTTSPRLRSKERKTSRPLTTRESLRSFERSQRGVALRSIDISPLTGVKPLPILVPIENRRCRRDRNELLRLQNR